MKIFLIMFIRCCFFFVAHIECAEFVLVTCFVVWFLTLFLFFTSHLTFFQLLWEGSSWVGPVLSKESGSWCPFYFSNHLAEEERAGNFTLIVLWLSVFCVSF